MELLLHSICDDGFKNECTCPNAQNCKLHLNFFKRFLTSGSLQVKLKEQTQSTIKKEVKESEVAQSCLTLCNPMDCSLPGSFIYWIFQARVLEQVAISFSRESPWLRDRTRVP